MPIVTTGLNVIRDAVRNICVNGEAGTSTTSVVASQTDLIAGVAATNSALSKTSTTTTFQTSHFISSVTAVGNTFAEWKIETSGGVMISRALTAGINHTATDEITKITTFTVIDR